MYTQCLSPKNRISPFHREQPRPYRHPQTYATLPKAPIHTEHSGNTYPSIRYGNGAPVQMVKGDGYLKNKFAYRNDDSYLELRELYRSYLEAPSPERKEAYRKDLISKCIDYIHQDSIMNQGRHKGRARMVNELLVKLGPLAGEYSDAHAAYEFGEDIVFGLDRGRAAVIDHLLSGNSPAFRFGMMQNDLTNAVWDVMQPTDDRTEDEVRASIFKEHPELIHNPQYVQDMVTRIMGFQDFIRSKYTHTGKEGYNIRKPIGGSMDEAINTWKHTSKAGLEYQLCQRKRDVCLAVDGLIIKDVIKGDPASRPDRVHSITSGEVRWLYRHKDDPDVRAHLKLFELSTGRLVPHDEFFGQSDWTTYDQYRRNQAAARGQAVQ